jgi:hypothetical protein
MKFLKLAVMAALGLGTVVCVSAPGDEPTTRPATQPAAENLLRVRRVLRALGGRTHGVAPYTANEWNDMMNFLYQNSPARYNVLAHLDLPENSAIRLDAIHKWRTYNFTKDHFPAVADELLKRFHLEDDLFVLMLKAQADDSQLAEYHDLIHDKVTQLVKLDFAERRARIEKLEGMLNDEKQKLDRDQAMEKQLIDRRTSAILNRLSHITPSDATPTTQPAGRQEVQDVNDPQPSGAAKPQNMP